MSKLIRWFTKNKTYAYLLVGFIVSFAFLVNVLVTIQLKFDNSELQTEISELENRIKGAKQELQQANSDAYIEKQATQRLGMVKTGDTPVKIIETEDDKKEYEELKEDEKQNKLRIYFKDWYSNLSEWVENK